MLGERSQLLLGLGLAGPGRAIPQVPLEVAVTDKFANITAIRVRDALETANRILDNISMAVRSTAAASEPLPPPRTAISIKAPLDASEIPRSHDQALWRNRRPG